MSTSLRTCPGCVPVILSDDLSVPFQDVIDWPNVSLKVPAKIEMEELHGKLAAVPFGVLRLGAQGVTWLF